MVYALKWFTNLFSRHRKVKCNRTQPVCGRCLKDNRQCSGEGYASRLILKDETQATINRLSKRIPTGQEQTREEIIEFGRTEWNVVGNQRLYNEVEQPYLAIFCCREMVTLRTLSWVLSEAKWHQMISEAHRSPEALLCAIRANAANYLARVSGAGVTPYRAFTEYSSALNYLQRDLYDRVKQRSSETLFTILLLGLFDVLSLE